VINTEIIEFSSVRYNTNKLADFRTESEGEKESKSDIQGVDQEQALRHLLESGSDSDSDAEKKEEANDNEEEEEQSSKKGEEGEAKDKKKKKKKKKKSEKKDANNGENLSDDDDDKGDVKDEVDGNEPIKLESASSGNNSGNSRDGTPDLDSVGPSKRKASSDLSTLSGSSNKKPKVEVSSVLLQSAA
jgi:hypothetical protein